VFGREFSLSTVRQVDLQDSFAGNSVVVLHPVLPSEYYFAGKCERDQKECMVKNKWKWKPLLEMEMYILTIYAPSGYV